MLKTALFAIAFASASVAVPPAEAAPCRDAKGKFVKCPSAAPAKPAKCKDAKGRFTKCGTPGAVPAK
ncbi:hypothetical protein [Sphingomonas sp.]|uniref:hypothetical protein n=1 Tax=Sphingomonas sp. TaxID=28214 RepID=UPI000DBC414F|nr:hypothetical protein [Sphingomonas sp.]PZT94332.1 MAG: hypothetical protein DI625_06190 [Sphingomonas sp.]